MYIFIYVLILVGIYPFVIYYVTKNIIVSILITIYFLVIFTIFPYYPLIERNLNSWLLHNSWNHSDWATFLAGVLGFSGAFAALYGIRWQVTREENNAIKGIKSYIKMVLMENLVEERWKAIRDLKYFSNSYSTFKWFDLDIDYLFPFSETVINDNLNIILRFSFGESFFKVYYSINKKNIELKRYWEQIPKRREVFIELLEQNQLNFEKIDKLYDEKISTNKDKIYYICVIITFLSRAIGEIKIKNLGSKITNTSIKNLKKSIYKVKELKEYLNKIKFDNYKFQSKKNFLIEENLNSFCKIIQKSISIIINNFKDKRDKRELCGKPIHYNANNIDIFDNIDNYEKILKEEINKILKDNNFEK